jgi:hypothetical protein
MDQSSFLDSLDFGKSDVIFRYKLKTMKQTAVEWLVNELNNRNWNTDFYKSDIISLIEQAKEMEKEQTERMYSEEDMAEAFIACWKANVSDGIECKVSFKEWFEQFKKK